ncbi:hypothetical protein CRE_06891 [Caenorhabditis remanei]|uniref:Uncharacterized protein n=1 Tax=Caenorhabditis remanei TaxID=31234 RepID=E3MZR0_CAERE|nr:hypothetical protein CRE_06891 [Caenorhabditis remanei]
MIPATHYMIKSNDNKSIWISKGAARHCERVFNIFQANPQLVIPVTAGGNELKKVATWCEQYKDGYTHHPPTDWDRQFLAIDDSQLSDVLTAARKLLVPPLMGICFRALCERTQQKRLEEKQKNDGLCYSIQSEDGQVFELTAKAAKLSGTICTMISTNAVQINNKENPIRLELTAVPLAIIFKWCEHHKMDGTVGVMTSWDKELLAIGNQELMEVLCAANALGVKTLFQMVTDIIGQPGWGRE